MEGWKAKAAPTAIWSCLPFPSFPRSLVLRECHRRLAGGAKTDVVRVQSQGSSRHPPLRQLQCDQRQQAMLHLEHACSERVGRVPGTHRHGPLGDRKSTRLNSSHGYISYAVFCLKKKKDTL